VHCVVDPGAVPPEWESPDWVIVGVKAHQLDSALPWYERFRDADPSVAGLQNGVESVGRLAKLTGVRTVIPVLAYCGGETVRPGRIRHGGATLLVTRQDRAGTAFQSLFASTAVQVQLSDDIVTEIWRKAIVNSALNGVTALARRRMDVLHESGVAELVRELMLECWRVGVSCGAKLDVDEVGQRAASLTAHATERSTTSMYTDWVSGAQTEHDAIYGAVIRQAAARGIDTPLHRAFAALLSAGSRSPHPHAPEPTSV
jgi:2-dehydropantoate 2-reductase